MSISKNNLTTPSSFIMDETMETVPKGKEIVTLDILKRHKDGDVIELDDNVTLAAPVTEREIAVLEAMAIDVYDMEKNIHKNGMSQSIALEMMRFNPSFINDDLPKGYFTSTPSKTGLNIGLEEIDNQKKSLIDKLKESVSKIIKWVRDKFKEYKDRFTTYNKSLKDKIGIFNKQTREEKEKPLDVLKQNVAKLCTTPELLEALKNFNIYSYYLEALKEAYFKPLNNEEGLKRIVLMSEARNMLDIFKNITSKITHMTIDHNAGSQSVNALAVTAKEIDNLVNDVQKSYEGFTSLDDYGVKQDEQFVSMFAKISNNVFGIMCFDELLPVEAIAEKIGKLNDITPQSPEDLSVICKISVSIVNVLNFAKMFSLAKSEVIEFSNNYSMPGSKLAALNLLNAVKKSANIA